MAWLFVLVAIIGDLLIVYKNKKGFFLWMLCDAFFCIHSVINDRFPEACVFGIYVLVAQWGLVKWSKFEDEWR